MLPGRSGGGPMIPPSTYRPPLSQISWATSRAVPGDTALASTYSPRKPCTAQATSSAACGGQTDRITPARAASAPIVPASARPAALARAAVSGLRPSAAHSTW